MLLWMSSKRNPPCWGKLGKIAKSYFVPALLSKFGLPLPPQKLDLQVGKPEQSKRSQTFPVLLLVPVLRRSGLPQAGHGKSEGTVFSRGAPGLPLSSGRKVWQSGSEQAQKIPPYFLSGRLRMALPHFGHGQAVGRRATGRERTGSRREGRSSIWSRMKASSENSPQVIFSSLCSHCAVVTASLSTSGVMSMRDWPSGVETSDLPLGAMYFHPLSVSIIPARVASVPMPSFSLSTVLALASVMKR